MPFPHMPASEDSVPCLHIPSLQRYTAEFQTIQESPSWTSQDAKTIKAYLSTLKLLSKEVEASARYIEACKTIARNALGKALWGAHRSEKVFPNSATLGEIVKEIESNYTINPRERQRTSLSPLQLPPPSDFNKIDTAYNPARPSKEVGKDIDLSGDLDASTSCFHSSKASKLSTSRPAPLPRYIPRLTQASTRPSPQADISSERPQLLQSTPDYKALDILTDPRIHLVHNLRNNEDHRLCQGRSVRTLGPSFSGPSLFGMPNYSPEITIPGLGISRNDVDRAERGNKRPPVNAPPLELEDTSLTRLNTLRSTGSNNIPGPDSNATAMPPRNAGSTSSSGGLSTPPSIPDQLQSIANIWESFPLTRPQGARLEPASRRDVKPITKDYSVATAQTSGSVASKKFAISKSCSPMEQDNWRCNAAAPSGISTPAPQANRLQLQQNMFRPSPHSTTRDPTSRNAAPAWSNTSNSVPRTNRNPTPQGIFAPIPPAATAVDIDSQNVVPVSNNASIPAQRANASQASQTTSAYIPRAATVDTNWRAQMQAANPNNTTHPIQQHQQEASNEPQPREWEESETEKNRRFFQSRGIDQSILRHAHSDWSRGLNSVASNQASREYILELERQSRSTTERANNRGLNRMGRGRGHGR